MRIVLHVPFGALTQEAGILHLLASHLVDSFTEVFQLRCNGAFAVCDRDAESNWTRRLHACSNCGADQKGLATWASIPSIEISKYLSGSDIQDTKRKIFSLEDSALTWAEIGGLNLSELCMGSFHNRFGPTTTFDLNNRQHTQVMRRLMLSAYRMVLATRKFHAKHQPDLVLASGGEDYITRSWVAQSKLSGRDVAVFKTDLGSRSVKILRSGRTDFFNCELLIQGVAGLRSDKATWPAEIVGVLEDVRRYLGVSEGQLSMPLAR